VICNVPTRTEDAASDAVDAAQAAGTRCDLVVQTLFVDFPLERQAAYGYRAAGGLPWQHPARLAMQTNLAGRVRAGLTEPGTDAGAGPRADRLTVIAPTLVE
jgi:hypothetical protein